jgi:hypothetical protein
MISERNIFEENRSPMECKRRCLRWILRSANLLSCFNNVNFSIPQVGCDLLVDRKEPPCQASSDASRDI